MYGICPACHAVHPHGTCREKRPNGNTICGKCGAKTPSRDWKKPGEQEVTSPKIGLSLASVREFLKPPTEIDAKALAVAQSEARIALAEHEAKRNPLGLPLRVVNGDEVVDANHRLVACCDSIPDGAEWAKRFAAAPKLAEFIQAAVEWGVFSAFDEEVAEKLLEESGYRKS